MVLAARGQRTRCEVVPALVLHEGRGFSEEARRILEGEYLVDGYGGSD
jgi:hypothetical protein